MKFPKMYLWFWNTCSFSLTFASSLRVKSLVCWSGRKLTIKKQLQTLFIVTLLDLREHLSVPIVLQFCSFPLENATPNNLRSMYFRYIFLDLKQWWKKEVIKLFYFNIFEMNNWDFLLHCNNTNLKVPKRTKHYGFCRIKIAVCFFVDILQGFSFVANSREGNFSKLFESSNNGKTAECPNVKNLY